jgi:HTH-type transcriptional regulator/antitoxin HigA
LIRIPKNRKNYSIFHNTIYTLLVSNKFCAMPNRKSPIVTPATTRAYNAMMKRIDALMKIGENDLTDDQAAELRALALAAQTYEKTQFTIPAPKTLEGLIELKMYEHKLKQKDLAKKMGVGAAKLSQILSRKRKPDVVFLKAAHKVLGIDGNVLLEYA